MKSHEGQWLSIPRAYFAMAGVVRPAGGDLNTPATQPRQLLHHNNAILDADPIGAAGSDSFDDAGVVVDTGRAVSAASGACRNHLN